MRADHFWMKCAVFAGTFALFVKKDNQLRCYTDAVSFRKVFYYLNNNSIVFATDVRLIEALRSLTPDTSKEAIEFYTSQKFIKKQKWVGNLTCYENVFQLLPNHYFDFESKTQVRFWPYKPKPNNSLQDGTKKSYMLISNILKGATKNFIPYVTLTAGWDSRVVLCATKNVSELCNYFVLHRWDIYKKNDPDIIIPRKDM